MKKLTATLLTSMFLIGLLAGCATSTGEKQTPQSATQRSMSDAEITAKVKSKLLLDPHTHGLTIHVITNNGVVLLEGEVNSAMEADLARQITLNTEGVVNVVNRLKVAKNNPAGQ